MFAFIYQLLPILLNNFVLISHVLDGRNESIEAEGVNNTEYVIK